MSETREIPLTRGCVAIVDAQDYERINQHKWYANGHGVWVYAMRAAKVDGKRVFLGMHREVLNAPDGLFVDHIDGDGLNNTRGNLRLATHAQNLRNSAPRNGVSGYKGVYRSKTRWRAIIGVDGRLVCLGSFATPEEAARAYDAKAREVSGDFAYLNFP